MYGLFVLFIFTVVFFFFNYTATTDIYTYLHTLSLHDALPISGPMPLLGDAKAARRGGQHQQGARTARQLGKRLGDAPIEVAIIAIVTPILLRAVRQRCGEAHPFGAIVVTMLEEMLGNHHRKPRA